MNSRVLLLVSLVLLIGASVLGYLAYQTTANAQAEALAAQKRAEDQATAGKAAMVVLAKPAKPFQVLTDDDLAVEMVTIPAPGTAQAKSAFVGRAVMTDLASGTPLNETHFNPGGQIARLLRAGERAVAIPVNDVVGGGGFLQPGDIVDIMLYLAGEETRRPSTQLVMRGVRVLSFGADLIAVAPTLTTAEADAQAADAGRRVREARTAVLAVSQADVSRLMLANSLGELRLAIVPTEELRQASLGMITAPVASNAPATTLPAIDVVPVPAKPTAVPDQKFYLTDAVLQPARPVPVVARSGAAGSAPPRVKLGPTVVIIRGLTAETN